KPVRQFLIEESTQLDPRQAALQIKCEYVARLGQRRFLHNRTRAGESIDRPPDGVTDAILAAFPEPGIGDADADAVDAIRHAAQERESIAEIGIERGESESRIRHAAREDAGRIQREAELNDALGRPATLGEFQA